ncbi:hypothetical protein [Agrobacterium tumefaciens]|uniref:hypothetical protein n=1 Tax=Agrobacterium tumefaciens TaxID=358 RepID=UPI001E627E25|nr:hypothetical protein [Agrobacterium tumefaciens]
MSPAVAAQFSPSNIGTVKKNVRGFGDSQPVIRRDDGNAGRRGTGAFSAKGPTKFLCETEIE